MGDVSRIIYDPGTGNINLDFPEIAEFADWVPQDVRNDAKSDGGVYESSFRHSYDALDFSLPNFPQEAFVEKFRSFWSFAKKGNTFTFLVDKTADDVNTTATAAAAAGQKDVVVSSVAGISPGDKLLLRSLGNFTDEVLTVDSIATLTITFLEDLQFPLAISDVVRSPGYFTNMRISPNMKAFPIVQEQANAWTLRMQMVEDIP